MNRFYFINVRKGEELLNWRFYNDILYRDFKPPKALQESGVTL